MYPPPDKPWPDDRAVHGARAGVLAELDASQAFASVATVSMGFITAGYELANKILSFYLSNVPDGSSFDVPGQYVDDVIRAGPKVSADKRSRWLQYKGQDLMESAIREILNEAYHNAEL